MIVFSFVAEPLAPVLPCVGTMTVLTGSRTNEIPDGELLLICLIPNFNVCVFRLNWFSIFMKFEYSSLLYKVTRLSLLKLIGVKLLP